MSKTTRQNKNFDPPVEGGCSSQRCCRDSLLPPGIVRMTDEAIAAERLLGGVPDAECEPVTVAAFDFDGTCINGSSPKKLVSLLFRRKLIDPYRLFRVGLWGLAYKLNLPKDAEGVRKRVFSAFKGYSAIKVNEYLCRFYHERIAGLYRPEADAEMAAHLEQGHVVVLVSASFEPIIASAMVDHPIQFALASRMKIDAAGDYTDETDGLPTEGPDKIVVLRRFLDQMFGWGNWELGWAYGDHFSDVPMLEAAKHPCAVTPDGKLRRFAQKRGWDVLDWS